MLQDTQFHPSQHVHERVLICQAFCTCISIQAFPSFPFLLQGAKALEDFAESVRNESGAALPKDGTVAEGTSNVIVFLEQLAEYADTAGAVLRRNTDIDQPVSSGKSAENGHRLVLGVYVSKFTHILPYHLFHSLNNTLQMR